MMIEKEKWMDVIVDNITNHTKIRCNKILQLAILNINSAFFNPCELIVNRGIFSFVKIHGLLRTGTNYLAKLLKKNFRVVLMDHEDFGWKHGPLNYRDAMNYVIVVKNPYSWVLSYKNWEEINSRIDEQLSLVDFLKLDITHPQLAEAWDAKKPIDVWNLTTRLWLKYNAFRNVTIILYEDLIEDFEKQMKNLGRMPFMVRRKNSFEDYSVRADLWETLKPRKIFRKEYYLNKEYMGDFNLKSLSIIRDSIDKQLVQNLGYDIY